MDESFILGLIAGEGSFSSALLNQNDTVYIYPIFQMGMSDVDQEIIERMSDELDIGTVNNSGGNAGWFVRGQDDVDDLIEFIEDADCELFELTEKYGQYERWMKLVEKKRASDGSRDERAELIRIARSITDSSAGDGNSAEEWIAKL